MGVFPLDAGGPDWTVGGVDFWTAALFLLALLLLRLVPYLVARIRFVHAVDALPGPALEGTHWLLAHLGEVVYGPRLPGTDAPDAIGRWIRWRETYAPEGHGLARIWLFNPRLLPFARPIAFVWDPDLAREVLSSRRYGEFAKGSDYRAASPLIGRGSLLAAADGPHWRMQRRIAQPAFAHAVLEGAAESAARLLKRNVFPRWDRGAAGDDGGWSRIEASSETLGLTLDVLGEVAFSHSFGGTLGKGAQDTEGSSLYEAFNCILTTLVKNARTLPIFSKLPTARQRRFKRSLAILDKIVEELVHARRREHEKEREAGKRTVVGEEKVTEEKIEGKRLRTKHADLLETLIRSASDLSDGNSEAEGGPSQPRASLDSRLLVDNIKTFLFAGHDTTGSTLNWAMWLLAKHPDVQRRLRDELCGLAIRSESGDEGGRKIGSEASPFTYVQLRSSHFLDAVLKETLRMYPPAALTREPLANNTVLGAGLERRAEGKPSYVIPKGTSLFIIPYLLHRDPAAWPDPDAFLPDRWIGGGGDEGRPYLPFSLGARNCIGMHLAQSELKSGLAYIVQNYEIAPLDDYTAEGLHEPAVILKMTLSPTPTWLKVRRLGGTKKDR